MEGGASMLLKVENIAKTYRKGKQVLRGIDLSVMEGEVVGLVGESGSGKSTLARVVMQLEIPQSGFVSFNGMPVEKSSRKAFYRDCQLIFQNASASFNPSWTVLEILSEPLRNKKKNRNEYIRKMLSKVNLNEAHLRRFPSELSGGEKQRVNLLRSILVEPKLLICDEIVSNLDKLIQKEIIDLLINLKLEANMAILFISHDLRIVEYMCDRILVMKDGEIVDESTKIENKFTFSHPYSKKLFHALIGENKNID